jgi:hypothetical protein
VCAAGSLDCNGRTTPQDAKNQLSETCYTAYNRESLVAPPIYGDEDMIQQFDSMEIVTRSKKDNSTEGRPS